MGGTALDAVRYAVNAEVVRDRRAIAAIGIASAALCTALGAYVCVPLPGTPVPMTLQTFFVLLSGVMLGRRLGTLSQLVYFVLGSAGLPLFARGGAGVATLLGPTGGYLFGFVAAAWLTGWVVSRSENASVLRGVMAMFIGMAVIYLFGATHLAVVWRLGVRGALVQGVVPFLPGDAVKAAAACAIWRGSRDRVKTIFG
jgi:biotin transport system substrate-specific component